MAFEEGKTVLACQKCGAQHECKWSRMLLKERSTVECRACGGIVYDRVGVHDYYEARLIGRT